VQESPAYKGGNQLLDYQLEGLNWMVFNYYNRRSCILADEMVGAHGLKWPPSPEQNMR
jgi:SNF2 family DNA or RNA helicase